MLQNIIENNKLMIGSKYKKDIQKQIATGLLETETAIHIA